MNSLTQLSILLYGATALASSCTAYAGEGVIDRAERADVRTFLAPPRDFDTLHASAEDLSYFGLPPRPADHGAASLQDMEWLRLVASPSHVVASVRPLPMQTARHPVGIPAAQSSLAYSYTWSGGVIATGATALASKSLISINGEFIVPIAQTAFGTCSGSPAYASEWVGLDGSGSKDIVQAGVETDAVCSAGHLSPTYYIWVEWYPGSAYKIANVSATPGSIIYIKVTSSSPTSALIYILNETANVATTVMVNSPSGISLSGSSAEWIVERPYTQAGLQPLMNYVKTYVNNAGAILNDGHQTLVQPGSYPAGMTFTMLDMVDSNGGLISVPTMLTAGSLMFQDQGSAK